MRACVRPSVEKRKKIGFLHDRVVIGPSVIHQNDRLATLSQEMQKNQIFLKTNPIFFQQIRFVEAKNRRKSPKIRRKKIPIQSI